MQIYFTGEFYCFFKIIFFKNLLLHIFERNQSKYRIYHETFKNNNPVDMFRSSLKRIGQVKEIEWKDLRTASTTQNKKERMKYKGGKESMGSVKHRDVRDARGWQWRGIEDLENIVTPENSGFAKGGLLVKAGKIHGASSVKKYETGTRIKFEKIFGDLALIKEIFNVSEKNNKLFHFQDGRF